MQQTDGQTDGPTDGREVAYILVGAPPKNQLGNLKLLPCSEYRDWRFAVYISM